MMYLTSVLLMGAIVLILSSAIGLLRLKDPMCQLHATGKVGSLAVVLVLLAHYADNMSLYMLVKTGMIVVLVYYTSAHATHIISNSMIKSKFQSKSNS